MIRNSSQLIVWFAAWSVTTGVANGGGFVLAPVGATGPHSIIGQEIRVPIGGTTVTLEVRVFGWDPNHDGNPKLHGCQAQIDASGFTSGAAGFLTAKQKACTTSADCSDGRACLGGGGCDISDHAFVDTTHPNYVFFGLNEINAVDFSIPNIRYGEVLESVADDRPDTGAAKYMGTLRLDVSPDADGTFTVGFTGPDGGSFFVWAGMGAEIPGEFIPARISVVTGDCNANGVPDMQDVATGTSHDCNNNGTPDECENDCDGNGWADECDLAEGCAEDCNANGVPDLCENDCNRNGFADECDVASGGSEDCDSDGVPDECEAGSSDDCNQNGRPDWCDVSAGTSSDCNGNGVPDECESAGVDCNQNGVYDACEPDCNGNGAPDECDIAAGASLDADHNGVPDECGTTVTWVPVGASRGHYITGNAIVLPAGGARITLTARVSGWDLNRDGDPRLALYQVTVDATGFTSGTSGSLGTAQIACASDNDCRGSSRCISGICDKQAAAFIDDTHADFALAGFDHIVAVNVSQPNIQWGGIITNPPFGSVADDGRSKYLATLLLDATADATGAFTIGFSSGGGTETFLGDHVLGQGVLDIPIQIFRAATITIVDDCNANGIPDVADILVGTSQDCDANGFPDECDGAMAANPDCNNNGIYDPCESAGDCNANGRYDVCDVANGTSEDINANGIPDECEVAQPEALAMGGRYLLVTPAPGVEPVALRVTSPTHGCMTTYVSLQGGTGRLSATPEFRAPADWGVVLVSGAQITPASMYHVAADAMDGPASMPATALTSRWGDVVSPFGTVNFQDLRAIVDRFQDSRCAVPIVLTDLYPAVPDGRVNFLDIAAGVAAFQGKPYPFAQPCP